MIGVAEFAQQKRKPFFGKKGKGPRKGSKKWVELTDGSIIKWWNNEWRFFSYRHNSKVATSLQMRAMSIAEENGRLEKVEERYTDMKAFVIRLNAIVGTDNLLKIIQWIQS